MPVQIIINAADPTDAMTQMATFLGLRGLQGSPVDETLKQANGEAGATATGKPRGRPRKEAAAPVEQQQEPEGEAAADDADEAQQEQTQAAGLTLDDVRAEMNKYKKVYGNIAAQEDIGETFKRRWKGKVQKLTDISPDMVEQTVVDLRDLNRLNPFKREIDLSGDNG